MIKGILPENVEIPPGGEPLALKFPPCAGKALPAVARPGEIVLRCGLEGSLPLLPRFDGVVAAHQKDECGNARQRERIAD